MKIYIKKLMETTPLVFCWYKDIKVVRLFSEKNQL
jgi:hypothetical protein